MKLSEEEKEDITDMVIESRDVEEDLTTVYLKGYADAEEKYRKTIKELETKQKEMCEEYCPKVEKIKELEEALLKVKDKNTTLFITCRNSIPKQKVKEIFNRLHINDIEPWSFYKVSGEILFDLKELLEDK